MHSKFVASQFIVYLQAQCNFVGEGRMEGFHGKYLKDRGLYLNRNSYIESLE